MRWLQMKRCASAQVHLIQAFALKWHEAKSRLYYEVISKLAQARQDIAAGGIGL